MELIEKHLNDVDTSNDAFLKLARDAGGFEKLNHRIHNSNEKELLQLLKPYGIELSLSEPAGVKQDLGSQRITDCVEFFPSSDRGRLHVVAGTSVYIDSRGRPSQAFKWFAPFSRPATTPRTRCQTQVGYFGISGDVGGHLVAASLGGYGGRANIVPQNRSFNSGPWYTVEYRAGRCVRSPYKTGYAAYAWYSSNTTSRPYAMGQSLSIYDARNRPVHTGQISYYNKAATTEMRSDASNLSSGFTRYGYCR